MTVDDALAHQDISTHDIDYVDTEMLQIVRIHAGVYPQFTVNIIAADCLVTLGGKVSSTMVYIHLVCPWISRFGQQNG